MEHTEATARRTHTWTPLADVDVSEIIDLDGLAQLKAYEEGHFPAPPIMSTLGLTVSTEPGSATVEMTVEEFHYNALGVVHGGVVSTLLDTAAGCSVHTTLGVGEAYTSLDLSVKFLRPVTLEAGVVRAVGRVLQRGRRTALAQAQLFDDADRLLAHATSSCMIFR